MIVVVILLVMRIRLITECILEIMVASYRGWYFLLYIFYYVWICFLIFVCYLILYDVSLTFSFIIYYNKIKIGKWIEFDLGSYIIVNL